jgi:hypothetical protein
MQVIESQPTVPAQMPAEPLDVGPRLRMVDAEPGRGAAAGPGAGQLTRVHRDQAAAREQPGDLRVGARGRLLGDHRACRGQLLVGMGGLAG